MIGDYNEEERGQYSKAKRKNKQPDSNFAWQGTELRHV